RRPLDRSRGDGLLGGRILAAGVRARVRADLRVLDRARVAAGARLSADERRDLAMGAPPGLAEHRVGDGVHRPHRPHDTRGHARRARAGLRAHRAGQGARSACGAARPCAQERGGPDRDGDRDRHRVVDRRRDRHRDRVRASRHRAPHGGCDPAARLPGDPGRRAAVLRGVRAGEPRRGPELHVLRPPHPVLTMAAVAIVAPKPTSPTWRNFREALRRHPTAIAGAVVLLLMVLAAVFAPWLATVDPEAVAPVKRLRPPGTQWWFGTDMMGRDVYSRVVYGTRVSLSIGISVAL